jgi:hypothetical protein
MELRTYPSLNRRRRDIHPGQTGKDSDQTDQTGDVDVRAIAMAAGSEEVGNPGDGSPLVLYVLYNGGRHEA